MNTQNGRKFVFNHFNKPYEVIELNEKYCILHNGKDEFLLETIDRYNSNYISEPRIESYNINYNDFLSKLRTNSDYYIFIPDEFVDDKYIFQFFKDNGYVFTSNKNIGMKDLSEFFKHSTVKSIYSFEKNISFDYMEELSYPSSRENIRLEKKISILKNLGYEIDNIDYEIFEHDEVMMRTYYFVLDENKNYNNYDN